MNLREFPIQTSKVSESIFVRKLRTTLSEVIYFPSQMETENISQLKELVQFIKNSPVRPSTIKLTPKSPIKTDSPKK